MIELTKCGLHKKIKFLDCDFEDQVKTNKQTENISD